MPYIQYPSLGGGTYLPSNGYLYYDAPSFTLYPYRIYVTDTAYFQGTTQVHGALIVDSNSSFAHNVELESIYCTNPYAANALIIEGTSGDGHIIRSENNNSFITILGDNGSDPGAVVTRLVSSGGSWTIDHTITLNTRDGAEYVTNNITSGKETIVRSYPGVDYAVVSTDKIRLQSDVYTEIYNPVSSEPALVVINNGAGPAFCIKMTDDIGNLYFGVQGNGAVHVGLMDDLDAQDNSIYYSTTISKLAYKDPGGTVNALY